MEMVRILNNDSTLGEGDKLEKSNLCKRSGSKKSKSPLVCFLYLLLRDQLPAGKVECIMQEIPEFSNTTETLYSNGYLLDYAKDVASRLIERNE